MNVEFQNNLRVTSDSVSTLAGMSLSDLYRLTDQLLRSINGCVAAAVIDLSIGFHLSAKVLDQSQSVDLMVASAGNLFTGKLVTDLEGMWNSSRNMPQDHTYFQEVTVQSENVLHIFLRGRRNKECVLALVCRPSVSLGLALNKARGTMPQIEDML